MISVFGGLLTIGFICLFVYLLFFLFPRCARALSLWLAGWLDYLLVS